MKWVVLALTLSVLAAGCRQPSVRLSYWAAADGVDPADAERIDDDLFDRWAGRIELTAAVDETVAFRLWVSYAGETGGDVSVTVDDWHSGTTTLGADAVTIYHVHAVCVERWPGWHIRALEPNRRRELVEDVLIPVHAPRGGLPCEMSDGDTLALWVDVHVPKGTPAGRFWSKLRILCDGEPKETIDLRLEVLPFALPGEVGTVLAADVDHAALFAHHVTYQGEPCRATRLVADRPVYAELQSALDATMRLLHAHKVSPLLSTLYPVIKVDALNRMSVLWEDYDRAVEGYLDGSKFTDRVGLPVWVVPFDEHFPAPPSYGAMQSAGYSRHLRQYLSCCAEHFARRGWLKRSFVEVPYAAQPSRTSVEALEHFARVIRKADARLRILSNLFPQDLGPYGWPDFPTGDLLGYVDIWCPPAQFYSPPAPIAGIAPAQMWMRADRPPYSGSIDLAASPADTRVLPWQAYHEKVPVVRLGVVNHWSEVTERPTAQACIDQTDSGRIAPAPLLYPGSIAGLTEPLLSVRLKRLRRGMFDLAYLKLMREKGVGYLAEVLADALAPFAGAEAYRYHYADPRPVGWVRDLRCWREAKQIMIDELVSAAAGRFVDPRERIAADVRWRRFLDTVCRVRIEVDGVRVRRAAPAMLGDVTIECAVVIRNGKRTPVSGAIDFGELPVGWSRRNEPVPVVIPAGESSHVTLTAKAAVVAWDDDGVRYLPLIFTTDDGRRYPISARMGYMSAHPVYSEIRIDGDLSDWPAGVGNLAADFVLICGEPADRPGDETCRPTCKTRVYAAADAEALYFAFDCVTEEASPVFPAHRNVVEYDDLVPFGDELVEIVIDPTGAGTHSTSDLYHVVIKPAGALWEQGIGTTPPTGRRRVWAADIQHAARAYPDRWVAEVRIPRAAFEADLSAGRIWGVNFARFDLNRQEYSTWSGAVRNFHDPASLGNLALP